MRIENIKNRYLIIVAIFLLAGLFYWFQVRPSQIRKGCHRWIVDMPGEIENGLGYAPARAKYDALYTSCLHKEGLW